MARLGHFQGPTIELRSVGDVHGGEVSSDILGRNEIVGLRRDHADMTLERLNVDSNDIRTVVTKPNLSRSNRIRVSLGHMRPIYGAHPLISRQVQIGFRTHGLDKNTNAKLVQDGHREGGK